MADIKVSYEWMIQKCNASNVGYSQAYRNAKIVKGIEYYDCSSIIWYSLIVGGFYLDPTEWPFTTSTMERKLLSLGFKKYSTNSSFQWEIGDIGLTTGHTEMCYKGGTAPIFMGARTGKTSLDAQVSIASKSRTFPSCFRFTGSSDVPSTPSSANQENNTTVTNGDMLLSIPLYF